MTRNLHKLFGLLLAVTVTVAQEPTLELQPASMIKSVGENVVVRCVANVVDKGLVEEMKWIHPLGHELTATEGESRVTTTSYPGQGMLDIVIQKVEQDDSGKYTCQAVYAGNVKIEKTINIEIYKDIDFGETVTFQTPIIHTDAKIKCLVTSVPPPQVDWVKEGKQIVPDNKRLIIQQDGLIIKNIDEDDEGVYKCRARVPQFGAIKFIDIQVEVHIPPQITGPPENVDGVEKEAVNFQCVATGKPPPTYQWVDREARPLNELEGYHVDDSTGQLTIMALTPDHSGEYRCTASNPAGDDQASANLRVLTKPKIERFENITIREQAESVLKCYSTGDPLPEIVFKKEANPDPFVNGANEDNRIIVKQEIEDGKRVGILEITDVNRGDDGLYTCTSESDGGVTVGWGHITVEFAPTFEEQQVNEFWSWEQEKVNLTCIATSIPNATVVWYWANEEIPKNDPNLRVLALGPTGVLEVNPISSNYFATYTCKATNIIGTKNNDLTLKQAHRPGPVGNTQVKKKTATTIEWGIMEPMDNGGRPVIGFIAEYRLADQAWDDAKNAFFIKGGEYLLENLTPQSTYVFRFAARNEVGDGEWGGEKSEEMPKISFPEEPLIYSLQPDIVNPSPYSSHFELMWKVPLDNGSPITSFELTYYRVKELEGKWEPKGDKINQVIEYPGETRYKIEGLHSDSIYKIEFRAKNGVGASRPAEVLIQTANDNSTDDTEVSSEVEIVEEDSESTDSGTDAAIAGPGGLNVGIIIAIVIISIILIAVITDAGCYFTKNVGLTAAVVGKFGDPQLAKDKEAMLEEGANTNDKHEGNGNMKGDEEKIPLTQDEEKPKETTEPTETTPMIQDEGKTSDKDAIISEEKQTLDEGKENEGEEKTVTKDSPV